MQTKVYVIQVQAVNGQWFDNFFLTEYQFWSLYNAQHALSLAAFDHPEKQLRIVRRTDRVVK